MKPQTINEYATSCVEKLGELVGQTRTEGTALGFSAEETKKVWRTIFEIFHEQRMKNAKSITAKNLATLIR